jgi:hypothetical protein
MLEIMTRFLSGVKFIWLLSVVLGDMKPTHTNPEIIKI